MGTGKTERAAIHAVSDYLDRFDKFEPFISESEKTPITDGYLNIYNNERHKVEDFFAHIHLLVKCGSSVKDNYLNVNREYLQGYMRLGGLLIFKVILTLDSPKILYTILTIGKIDDLLKQSNKSFTIGLKELPTEQDIFEKELFAFASIHNEKEEEHLAPNDIRDLIIGIEEIREFLGEIKDLDIRCELESSIDSIQEIKDSGAIGWRDKFIYYSCKALDLATNHIKCHDFSDLLFQYGGYLQDQKQYHLVENYYLMALEGYIKLEDKCNVAVTLNNLGNLHQNLKQYSKAEKEYQEALKIYRDLAKSRSFEDKSDVAMALNNLAILHTSLNQYTQAEQEYKEALVIYQELAKAKRDAYIAYVAQTLNNLAALYNKLSKYEEAEKELEMALKYYYELSKSNRYAFIEYVAGTLNNLASLHENLLNYEKAEFEYQEALKIYRELAETNREAYIVEVANTLNNIAVMHAKLNQFDKAEVEWKQALKIYRELAIVIHDAYIGDVAMTLYGLAMLHAKLKSYDEAEQECHEALKIFRELSETNRDLYIENLAMTLYHLALLQLKNGTRLVESRITTEEALGIFIELGKVHPQIWNDYIENVQHLLDFIINLINNK